MIFWKLPSKKLKNPAIFVEASRKYDFFDETFKGGTREPPPKKPGRSDLLSFTFPTFRAPQFSCTGSWKVLDT